MGTEQDAQAASMEGRVLMAGPIELYRAGTDHTLPKEWREQEQGVAVGESQVEEVDIEPETTFRTLAVEGGCRR